MRQKQKPSILLLAADEQEAKRLASALGQGTIECELTRLQTQDQFQETIAQQAPDLIVAVNSPGKVDGLATLASARKLCPQAPFILVTETTAEPLTLQALAQGVDACVAKDCLEHLPPKVKRWLELAKEQAQSACDLVELRRAEENIQRVHAELEQRVEQRTRELQAANKELEAFSYSVSHDLRAPLRHIMAFIYLLEQNLAQGSVEQNRKYVQTIVQAAERMGHLVDDLLAFSRVSRQEMRRLPVQLKSLVNEARSQLEEATGRRQIEWVIAELPVVEGDPIMLRQAFVNLLSNAIKYTSPKPQARIEVGSTESAGEIICYVRDNGVGFDMRAAEKLFGVFQRLHSEKEFEGTGIGLALVRRTIQRHGGRTWAEGVVEQGATFYFSLPKTPAVGAPASLPASVGATLRQTVGG